MMHFHGGMSARKIARTIGIHRETVGKYIKQYQTRREQLLSEGNTSVDIKALIDSLVSEPKYNTGPRPKRKITKEIEQRIKYYLEENEEKRKRGQQKQVKKVMDIYEALVNDKFDISYSSVLRLVRKLNQKSKEAFIKETYLPGDICEFDWGEVKLFIGGKLQTLQMAAFASAYGNDRYGRLFIKQTTECFQEAHALYFEHMGGVYQTFVYDNMKVAVKRFVGTEKEPTEGLLKLSIYYGFRFRFCNVRRGNEKGHVERTVDVLRRKAFAFRDTFETLEEANAYLLEVCSRLNNKPQDIYQGQSAAERTEQEKPYWLVLPPMFDAARIGHFRVDKYSTVVVDQNRYSVPDHLVGRQVMVKVYSSQVQCFYEGTNVAEHPRLVGNHEWQLDIKHYLATLKKKPGALAGSLALQQASTKIKNIYARYYSTKPKDFIELLQFIQSGVTLSEVEYSIEKLRQIHPDHVTTDKIKVICAKQKEIQYDVPELSENGREISEKAYEHLQKYKELFQTGDLSPKEAIA